MTLIEYNKLSEEKKWVVIWDRGIFLGDDFFEDTMCMTYAVHDFYVNVIFDQFGRAEKVEAFEP